MSRIAVVVVVSTLALPGCRIFGSGIPCEESADCPTRLPVCVARDDGAGVCVAEGAGPGADGGTPDGGGPPPHDGGGDDDDGGVDGGGDVDDGGVDGGVDAGPPPDPCEWLTVTSVAPLCRDEGESPSSFTLTIEGAGFARALEELPTVTVTDVAAATDVALSGCVPAAGGEMCDTLTATLPAEVALGDYEVVVENPAAFGCDAAYGWVEARNNPVVLQWPTEVCEGAPIVLEGTGLGWPTVTIDGEVVDDVVVHDYDADPLSKVRARKWTIADGPVTLRVDNEGCFVEHVVTGGPPPAFRDAFPTVLYAEQGHLLPLWVLADEPFELPSATLYSVDAEVSVPLWPGPSTPAGYLLLEVNAGALAPGEYTVEVEPSAGACRLEVQGMTAPPPPTTLPTGIQQSATTTSGAINRIDFHWPWPDPAAPDLGGPHAPTLFLFGPTPVAPVPLAVREGGVLSATVAGDVLSAGTYSVYASDTYGVVLRSPAMLTVHDDPPLRISSVTPASFPTGTTTTLHVDGDNLQAAAGPTTATLLCVDQAGFQTAAAPVAGSLVTTTRLEFMITPTMASATCSLQVDRSDGSSVLYSAGLSTTHPTPPTSMTAGPPLATARGDLAVAVSSPQADGVDVFAVAGTDGSAPTDVVERMLVYPWGLSSWRTQTALPVPLESPAAVVIDDALFVVGGRDDDGFRRTEVWRAPRLPESSAPSGLFVSAMTAATGPGLSPGLYHYAVSAVFPEGHPLVGAGVATLPVAALLRPEVPFPASLRLAWDPVDGAVLYRVYRTTSPGDPGGTMTLLAEVVGTELVDAGASSPAGAAPRLAGDLGDFQVAAHMSVARAGHGAAVIDHTGGRLLVVAGGFNAGGALSDAEAFLVQAPGDGTHELMLQGFPPLASARERLTLVNVPSSGQRVLLAGPGVQAATFEHFDATTTVWTATPGSSSDFAGSGLAVHGLSLLSLGDTRSAPAGQLWTTSYCSGGNCPVLGSWVSWTQLGTARSGAALASVGGRVLVVGGYDGDGTALSSTETGAN